MDFLIRSCFTGVWARPARRRGFITSNAKSARLSSTKARNRSGAALES